MISSFSSLSGQAFLPNGRAERDSVAALSMLEKLQRLEQAAPQGSTEQINAKQQRFSWQVAQDITVESKNAATCSCFADMHAPLPLSSLKTEYTTPPTSCDWLQKSNAADVAANRDSHNNKNMLQKLRERMLGAKQLTAEEKELQALDKLIKGGRPTQPALSEKVLSPYVMGKVPGVVNVALGSWQNNVDYGLVDEPRNLFN